MVEQFETVCEAPIEKQCNELSRRALQVAMEPLTWPLLNRHGIELILRRDDQVDDELSGNKFYKLFFNIQAATAAGFTRVASFGGAYSNHLHALAAAGHRHGLQTLGLVRGEQPARLSSTLEDAQHWGMTLCFLPRELYRQQNSAALTAYVRERYGDVYLIPEGGANAAGCRGAMVIAQAIEARLDGAYAQVCMPCGTGTTLAGVAAGLPTGKIALGFSVLKGAGNLGVDIDRAYRVMLAVKSHTEVVKRSAGTSGSWRLLSGYHSGGYGKKLPKILRSFWREFELETGLQLDPVYTLKMFHAIACLAQAGYWPKATRLVVIHTGGLQGRRGFAAQIDW